jgi:hypothetical protein
MDVKFIKLITGEDVIAMVSEETETTYTLKNPTRIMMNNEGIGLGPIHPFLQDTQIIIKKDHVVFQGNTEPEIKNAYNAQFGSGIVTAPASALNLVGLND